MRSFTRHARKLLRKIGRGPREPTPSKPERRDVPVRKSPQQVLGSAVSPASFEYKWARLVVESAHDDLLRELVGTTSTEPDTALRRLLPQLENKLISDGELATPASIPFVLKHFPSRDVATPIEWSADAVDTRDERLWLQSLSWIDALYISNGDGLGQAAYVVVDWYDRALTQEPELELTWDEHAMAARLDRTWRFLLRYIDVSDTLNRRVIHAAVSIILSHLYGLAVEFLYAVRHNHGIMQDRTPLLSALRLPSLLDSEKLADLAEQRLLKDQVRRSVTEDFIHKENSPGYQWLYVRMLTTILSDAYSAQGRTPPVEFLATRDGLLDSLAYLLQPNLTAPQFGDSLNDSVARELRALLKQANRSIPIDPAVHQRIVYLLTDGVSGAMPPNVDRVFQQGGLAAFRESWGGEAPHMRVTAHFTCSHLSSIHYHQDETSFEIYGYGEEIVVDTGRHNNDRSHPLTKHGTLARAHNLLVVDGKDFGSASEPSRIVRSGGDQDQVWVQGSHSYYRELGIRRQVRAFAYLKPNVFLVLDSVEATGNHCFEQHFHLHPSFMRLERVAAGGTVAHRADGAGITFLPCDSRTTTRTIRGDEGIEQSWWFPFPNEAQPATDVVLRRDASAGIHHLAALLVLSAPDEPLERVEVTDFTVGNDSIDLQFRCGGKARRMRLDTGPF